MVVSKGHRNHRNLSFSIFAGSLPFLGCEATSDF